jgi:hypothetical protein
LALQTGLKHIFSKFIKSLHFLTVEDGSKCTMSDRRA